MNRSRLLVVLAATAIVVAASYIVRSQSSPSSVGAEPDGALPVAGTDAGAAAAAVQVDEAELDRLIELFVTRSAEHGESLDYRTAGGLLLQRAELEAAVDDYAAARDSFATALTEAPGQADALLGLGRSALGTHDFATARSAATSLLAEDPGSTEALALAGDAALAVGAYDDAATAFDALAESAGGDPAVLVRLAQLELVRKGPDEAQRLARESLAAAVQAGLAAADLAFYESFAGHLAYQLGRYDEATELLEQAVAHAPTDHGALGELARVRAATGDTAAAIELLERANSLIAEPDHLVLQGDLQHLAGDPGAAQSSYAQAVAIATRDADHQRAWARALARYHLDHDGDLDLAHAIATQELSARKDVGAWDLAAWAHYRRGDLAAARTAIDTALELAVPDATVSYHAGVISAAVGDHQRAVVELSAALELNPGFDPLLARHAEEVLAEVARASRPGALPGQRSSADSSTVLSDAKL